MVILHYALGFPPYRTGGLTKFCVDLMQEQMAQGHAVGLLWPGEMQLLGEKTYIRVGSDIQGIKNYEVINPTPISYDEGISDVSCFMKEGDYEYYLSFFQKHRPDILHVHTLMGLHKAMLTAAKQCNVKLVFTTHDFYPICPKVTLFRGGQVCPTVGSCQNCTACNTSALPMWKVMILQSPLYRILKDSALVKKLRKGHRDQYFKDATAETPLADGDGGAYKKLRHYYESLIQMMDVIHYNSSVTRMVYQTYMQITDGVLIPISHKDVVDKRREKTFSDKELRITYMGQQSGAKGYFILKDAMDQVYSQAEHARLNIFFEPMESAPYLNVHGRFAYCDLEKIFERTDVLVAPSIWYETFGYTVLEALSYGVPVVISSNVGAQDILPAGAGIIVENINAQNLASTLLQLTPQKLEEMNRIILQRMRISTMSDVAQKIEESCYCK